MASDPAERPPASLPPLVAAWTAGAGLAAPPAETKATCQQCAMCSAEAPHGSAQYYHPDVKCCSYEPALPNFLVGRILRDVAPERAFGRGTVEQRIARQAGVGPWGLEMPRRYAAVYGAGARVFGRSPDLLCSHYQPRDGSCGIWPYRNGVCATWFCKHERGGVGHRFWRSLNDLLGELEWSLGVWCVTELGAPAEELARLVNRRGGELVPSDLGAEGDTAYREAWGDWAGREAEFFDRAATLVDGLDWAEIERIGGVRLRVHTGLVRATAEALATRTVPARTKLAPLRIVAAGGGTCTVDAPDSFERLRMPDVLLRALTRFDGRPTAETVDEVRALDGVGINPGLLQKLVDFGLLTAVADRDPGRG